MYPWLHAKLCENTAPAHHELADPVEITLASRSGQEDPQANQLGMLPRQRRAQLGILGAGKKHACHATNYSLGTTRVSPARASLPS